MAQFGPAYLLERKHEGYYVNNPADKGGETYAGIARNIHPYYKIWPYVDSYKRTIGRPLKTNEKIPGENIEQMVREFYNELWNKQGFSKINSQEVANILYDWFINSGSLAFRTTDPETFGIQEILNRDFKKNLTLDGVIGPKTLDAINNADPVRLYNTVKKERIRFYNRLVERNPSQLTFLKGWLSRINSFTDLKTTTKIGLMLVFIIGFFAVMTLTKTTA